MVASQAGSRDAGFAQQLILSTGAAHQHGLLTLRPCNRAAQSVNELPNI